MNIFSFLLSGASFATSVLAPTQWLIPVPQCLPLHLQQESVWNPAHLSGIVSENSIHLQPLLQGEVKISWQVHCDSETILRLDANTSEQSFIKGVFEQTGLHAQELHSEHNTFYFKAPGNGSLTLYFADIRSHVSLSVATESSSPSVDMTYHYLFPWRFFTTTQDPRPAFFEVRSAVTGYVPQEKDTVPVVCHTRGDLLSAAQPSSCNLARLDSVATQNMSSLYAVANGTVKLFSPPMTFIKPQVPGDVIISEVMWAGSYFFEVSLQSDQWIELYNATDTLVNLAGARLRGAKPLGDIIFYSDLLIPSKGFVIVGKQGNDKTSLIRNPDKIDLLSLPPAGRSIQLISNQGVILDETPAPPWPAGKDDQLNKVRASMQRSWFELLGSDSASWGDCSQQTAAFRCTELSKNQWRSLPGQNLGTPWQHSVL